MDRLPPELIGCVFQYLPRKDALVSSGTCRAWRENESVRLIQKQCASRRILSWYFLYKLKRVLDTDFDWERKDILYQQIRRWVWFCRHGYCGVGITSVGVTAVRRAHNTTGPLMGLSVSLVKKTEVGRIWHHYQIDNERNMKRRAIYVYTRLAYPEPSSSSTEKRSALTQIWRTCCLQ